MSFSVSRRHFLRQTLVGGLALPLSGLATALASRPLHAAIPPLLDGRSQVQPPVLHGPVFKLHLTSQIINVTAKPVRATLVNGLLPGPTLHMREGETVTIHVTNHMKVPSSLHWHGILLPYEMDGVPGMSFPGIAPGETFTYRFTLLQNGTYWYHSHSGMQEQTGMVGAIVVSSRKPEPISYEQDEVIFLSDWTNDAPASLLHKLTSKSDFDNYHKPTFRHFVHDAEKKGFKNAVDQRTMWSQMRMNPTDYSDLSGVTTFQYLLNGFRTADRWRTLFKKGSPVRLRLINGAAQTIFDVRIPGTTLTVVAADGQWVKPVTVDELRIAPGQTYDVLFKPSFEGSSKAYTLFAQSVDRTGFVAGTLATDASATAPIPPLDKPQWLEMQDMMGNPRHTRPVSHATTEYGWQTDMRVDTPRINLDDPGVNLRRNGRRVLTYADLQSLQKPVDATPPQREIELHLTGNMERYVWGFDGLSHGRSAPIHLTPGQRTRFKLVNDTMMMHPIHLHGMWMDLADGEGRFKVRKHTVLIQPAQMVLVDVTPIAGWWPLHCHLMYHMDAGMFREVVVSLGAGPFKNRGTGRPSPAASRQPAPAGNAPQQGGGHQHDH